MEEAKNNYSAYSPDYLGCVATGDTIEETKINMLKALVAHIEAETVMTETLTMSKQDRGQLTEYVDYKREREERELAEMGDETK